MVSVRNYQVALSAIVTQYFWLLHRNVNTYITLRTLLMDLWRIATQKMSTYSSYIMYMQLHVHVRSITLITSKKWNMYTIDMYYMNALPTHTTHLHSHQFGHFY